MLMIVDLLRNDLGRVCEYGTIEASAIAELETFAQFIISSRPSEDAWALASARSTVWKPVSREGR